VKLLRQMSSVWTRL